MIYEHTIKYRDFDITIYDDSSFDPIVEFNNLYFGVFWYQTTLILTCLKLHGDTFIMEEKIPEQLYQVLESNEELSDNLQINYTNIYTDIIYLDKILKVINDYSENIVFI